MPIVIDRKRSCSASEHDTPRINHAHSPRRYYETLITSRATSQLQSPFRACFLSCRSCKDGNARHQRYAADGITSSGTDFNSAAHRGVATRLPVSPTCPCSDFIFASPLDPRWMWVQRPSLRESCLKTTTTFAEWNTVRKNRDRFSGTGR